MPGEHITIEVNGREAGQAAVSLLEHEGWGITMLVLQRQLTAAGIGQAEKPVCVQDLAGYDGMILCNSRGWAPVSRVDDMMISQDEAFTGLAAAAIDGCPWDEI